MTTAERTALTALNPYMVGGPFATISRVEEQVRLVSKLASRRPEVAEVGFYDYRGEFYAVWKSNEPDFCPNCGLADSHRLSDYIARNAAGRETTLAALYN